jgi:hypothetical protein
MRGIWRFIVLWRYLLAALLVLAAACGYVFIPQPEHVPSQADQPQPLSPLWEKYQGIESGMTGPQVERVLGPPQEVEVLFSHSELWIWRDGRETVTLIMSRTIPGTMILKNFNRAEDDDKPARKADGG